MANQTVEIEYHECNETNIILMMFDKKKTKSYFPVLYVLCFEIPKQENASFAKEMEFS